MVGDALPSLLAPCFATDEAMDPATVMRETHARIKNMMLGGKGAEQQRGLPSYRLRAVVEHLLERVQQLTEGLLHERGVLGCSQDCA